MTAYHGGKQRIGKKLAEIIVNESIDISEEYDFKIKGYCEPFCGMLGVYQHIPTLFDEEHIKLKYKAGDTNKSVIMMWKAVKKGWKPQLKITSEKEFKSLKITGKSSAKKGFIGHHYGYMAKYFQPFKTSTLDKLKKTIHKISEIGKKINKANVIFKDGIYTQYSNMKGYIIYCDPPYEKQAHYYNDSGEHMPKFDHKKFWEWCRKMSHSNIVFVSEYKAPKDFIKIWEGDARTTGPDMKEKLYVIYS